MTFSSQKLVKPGGKGDCSGAVIGIEEGIMAVLQNKFPDVSIVLGNYYFDGLVNVKAMNPGVDSGPQNYPLVDVCVEVDPPDPI